MLVDLIRLARPSDWVKNVFVLIPAPFALAAGATLDPLPLATGFAAMCLASSAAYAVNDARDAERDRAHPLKRDRPVASGRVPPGVALVFSAVLAAAALALSAATGHASASTWVVVYLALNLL